MILLNTKHIEHYFKKPKEIVKELTLMKNVSDLKTTQKIYGKSSIMRRPTPVTKVV